MDNWFKLLKKSLTLELPEDSISKNKDYGRIRDNLKHIYPSVLKYWKIGTFAYTLLFFSSLLAFPMPMISRYLIDNVILKKHLTMLVPVLGLMVVVGVTSVLSGRLQGFYNTRFDQKVMLDLQERLLKRIFSLPKSFFDRIQQGYLMSRISSDIGGVKWFFSSTLVQAFVQVIKFIGGIAFLFYLEWRIALPVVIFLPVPLIITKYFARRTYIMSHHNRERGARYNSIFQEIFSSIPLIKSFSSETRSIERITNEIKENNKIANEQMLLGYFNSTIQNFVPKLAGYFVLGFGAYWVITGYWTLGSLVAFRAYLSYVYGPVGFITSTINQFQSSQAALHRTAALFDTIPEPNTEDGIKVEKLKGEVKFNNVYFSYEPNKPVLENITIKAVPGEHWAIIGESGVGKTTLISTIMCFYKPDSGEIYFDGRPSLDYNVRSLRSRIGYVAQSTQLLTGTIAENLRYGNPDAPIEDIIEAAKTAEIHEFIEELPNKYNTLIEEGGVNLSEGQKQRLSIARALVKKPDILIFDEPTSALDNITEKSIYHALPKSVKGKTTFTIAHRLSTIKNADKIIMLRKHKKPLTGKHAELIECEQDYKDFFNENYD